MKILRRIAALLGETFSRWNTHNAASLGAAIAFYTLLSAAPLLIFLVAIVSIVFGRQPVEYRIVDAAHQIIGANGAATIQGLMQSAHKPAEGFIASALAAITLLFGASGVFTELRDALNRMWDVSTCDTSGIIGLIKQRVFSFIMVLTVGLLLALSILAAEVLALIQHFVSKQLPAIPVELKSFNFLLTFCIITFLFAMIFRFVPDILLPWSVIWIGAAFTALLFSAGKALLGLYLSKASFASVYGAAGSLVVFIIWVYYSAQIFLFGAEFTRVIGESFFPKEVTKASRLAFLRGRRAQAVGNQASAEKPSES